MTETDARYRHASGEMGGECSACWDDSFEPGAEETICSTAEPDPAEPGLCRWCSHSIERVA